MKKLLIGVTGVIVIAAVGAGLWYHLSPAQVARRAIERYASKAIGTHARIERVQLSLDDGSGIRPRITIESGQAGSNFELLLNNIQHYAETSGPPDSRERKFVIERLVIHGATVSSVPAPDAGQTIQVDMPQVSVSNIGLAKEASRQADSP